MPGKINLLFRLTLPISMPERKTVLTTRAGVLLNSSENLTEASLLKQSIEASAKCFKLEIAKLSKYI